MQSMSIAGGSSTNYGMFPCHKSWEGFSFVHAKTNVFYGNMFFILFIADGKSNDYMNTLNFNILYIFKNTQFLNELFVCKIVCF